MEVEILIAEVGQSAEGDQLFHILYDGTVLDEKGFSVLGGDADAIGQRTQEGWSEGLTLGAAVRAAVSALAGPDRTLAPTTSRWPSWSAAMAAGASAASTTPRWPSS